MAALNVDYIVWITTVLGAINSNLTFIFYLNYYMRKLKTSERQGVSFLLETTLKVFRFETKPISHLHQKLIEHIKVILHSKFERKAHLRETFYGTLIFQQSSMICIGRHVGGHTLALQHGGQNYIVLNI